jgi:predicted Zn-dependent protease
MRPRLRERWARGAAVAGFCAVIAGRAAPAQVVGQGFQLERTGQLDQAASFYLAALRAEPANLSALLGLERVLPPLHRLAELVPVARRAVAARPEDGALRAVLLRTYVALNEPDSARAAVLAWAAAAPGEEAPYREWAMALEDAQQPTAARAVLLAGRRAVGRPSAFAIELAELSARLGDWEGAAREWAAALGAAPAQLDGAARQLAQAPPARREAVVRALTAGRPLPLLRRLAAELLLGWGEAERAWAVFEPSLGADSADAGFALRRFAELAAAQGAPGARRVQALALARYAAIAPAPARAQAWADAARASVAAGDRAAARAALARVAGDSSAPPEAQALAQAAFVAALIDEGQLDDAAERLGADARLHDSDRAALRLRLARARIARGDLERAAAALGRDSSVDALAVRGWIALYRGRLAEARRLFQAAGPYAGDRGDATARTAMVALLAQLPRDSFPELGAGLLALARGDSARAVVALRDAAATLPPGAEGGRPDVLLVAARVAARLGDDGRRTALALCDEIVRTGGTGAAAPAAELEWARLLVARGEIAAAVAHLEHLILAYPGSAVVPEARRELARAKDAIPKS